MSVVVKWTLDTKELDRIAKHMGVNTDEALGAMAFEVEQTAKPLAPVDTGALRSSIHTEKMQKGLYHVADGVEYGIYQELGNYKMAAQPFMVPAVEKVRKNIAELFKRLFK